MVRRITVSLAELSTPWLEVVGYSADAAEAIRMIRELMPDVVILDIFLAASSGLDVLRQTKREGTGPTFVVLTNYPNAQIRERCNAAGVKHFFDKSLEFERIRDVISELVQERLGC